MAKLLAACVFAFLFQFVWADDHADSPTECLANSGECHVISMLQNEAGVRTKSLERQDVQSTSDEEAFQTSHGVAAAALQTDENAKQAQEVLDHDQGSKLESPTAISKKKVFVRLDASTDSECEAQLQITSWEQCKHAASWMGLTWTTGDSYAAGAYSWVPPGCWYWPAQSKTGLTGKELGFNPGSGSNNGNQDSLCENVQCSSFAQKCNSCQARGFMQYYCPGTCDSSASGCCASGECNYDQQCSGAGSSQVGQCQACPPGKANRAPPSTLQEANASTLQEATSLEDTMRRKSAEAAKNDDLGCQPSHYHIR